MPESVGAPAGPGSPHQVIMLRNGIYVTDKLGRGLRHAGSNWVACIQADLWLPPGSDGRLAQPINEAERRYCPIGVAGVYGVGDAITSDDPARPTGVARAAIWPVRAIS